MGFEIKTEHFTGPFELLLELIERRKLFINELSLSKVTDDFISYINSKEDFPLAESAQFILIASTLLLIKSRSLLPNLELTQGEQADIKSLENRLTLYKMIKNAGREVESKFGRDIAFEPRFRTITEKIFLPGTLELSSIQTAILKVVDQIPKSAKRLPEIVVKKVVSLEEMITQLAHRIEQGLRIGFREFSGKEKTEKINVIVSFLAMLELVKRGAIRVEQRDIFDDIEIETVNVDTPRYG